MFTIDESNVDKAHRRIIRKCREMDQMQLEKVCAELALLVLAYKKNTELSQRVILQLERINRYMEMEAKKERAKNSAKGRLSSRDKKKDKAKYQIRTFYLECARGEHPEISTVSKFCKEMLRRHLCLEDDRAIRNWIKDWQAQLDFCEEPVRTFRIKSRALRTYAARALAS